MATTNVKTFTQLRNEIKAESKVEGADNLDGMIFDLIQELLTTECENKGYLEMLVLNTEIPTVSVTPSYILPNDFMRVRTVRYRQGTFPLRVLYDKNLYAENPIGNQPRYYEVAGDYITIEPYANIPNGDTIVLDYYKYPTVVDGASNFPIPKLIATVKQKAIARVHVYNKAMQQAQALQAEGVANSARGHTSHS